jgi:phosphate transport system substrate-binding protein
MAQPSQTSPTPQSTSTTTTETIQRRGGSHTGAYIAIAVMVIIVIIVGAAYAAGIGPFAKSKTGGAAGTCSSTSLLGAGSTLVAPLMQSWETHYTTNSVNYQAVGSSAGISQITAKTVDFGASDAPLNASQRAALPGILEIPESAGAVAIIFNVPGVSSLQLTGQVLANIFLGTVTTWNDPSIAALNPGVTLPSASIVVVHRSDGSGTTFALTDFLSHDSSTWASTKGKTTSPSVFPVGVASKGSSGVAGTVSKTPDAIGYVDLVYALNALIPVAKIQNPAGNFVLPSINDSGTALADAVATANAGGPLPAGDQSWYNVSLMNAKGAGDYPIVTFTYVMVYQDLSAAYAGTGNSYSQQKAEDLANWLNWMVSPTNGQSFAAALYYIPLPASVVSIDTTTIGSMTYGGSTIPACT